MAATLIDGKALAAKVREEVAASVAGLGHVGVATVLVGDDPASHIYINLKHKAADAAGFESRDHRLPAATSEEDVLALIAELNADDAVDGLLVQLPLPGHIDETSVIEAIDPAKDIDGIHPYNAGRLALSAGRPSFPGRRSASCACSRSTRSPPRAPAPSSSGAPSSSASRCRSSSLQANATVTVCHSRTRDLAGHTLEADILVAAVGQPHVVTPDMVKPGSTVIDVGLTRTDDGLRGDVDPAAAERAGYLTPVPGGVGPMTIAMVLQNTVTAARARREKLANPAL